MKKSFLFNAFFVLLLNLLIKPLYLFGIDRNVQLLTKEDYGLYYTFFSMAFILNILSDMGIQNFNLRFTAQNSHLIQKNFSRLLSVKIGLAILFFGAYFLFGLISNYPFEYPKLFLLVGLSLWMNAFLLFIRSFIAGYGWYILDSLLSILDKLFLIVVVGIFITHESWKLTFTIEDFVFLQVLSYLLPIGIGIVALLKLKISIRPQWNKVYSLALLKQSIPFALVILLMSIYARIDTVMLAWLHPTQEVAVDQYAESYRILEALNMFGFLLSGLLLPMFSRSFKSNITPNKLFYSALGLSMAISIPLTLSSLFFTEDIMQMLYYHKGGAEILKWHLLAFAVNTISYLFGTLITSQGSIHKLNMLFLFGCVLNIILNYIVIPRYGPQGTAFTTLITQIVILVGQALYSFIRLKLCLDLRLWLKNILFIILLSWSLSYGLDVLKEDWVIKYMMALGFGFAFALILGILDMKGSIELIKSKFSR